MWWIIRVSKKRKEHFFYFLISLLISIAIGVPLRGTLGYVDSAIIESICYMLFTYYILRKYAVTKQQAWLLTGFVLLGRIALELPIRIIHFNDTFNSLPGMLIVCMSIVFTSLVYRYRKIYLFIIVLSLWGYCAFWGYSQFLHYRSWGPSFEAQVGEFTINTPQGSIQLKEIEGDYVLLDFWSRRCGICFKKFPEIQSLYNKSYKNLTIASVFVSHSEDEPASLGQEIIEERKYTFPVWSVASTDTLLKVLKINAYPTFIVLDKERNVICRGNLEDAKKQIKKIDK